MTVTASALQSDSQLERRAQPLLAIVVALLGLGMAFAVVLGPLVLDVLTYRTSPTTLNQLKGADAATLSVVAPLALVTALLAARGHRAAPLLASGIGVFAVYTYAQVIIGQEYVRVPGNVEHYFLLLLGVFVLAEAAIVLGLRSTPSELPSPSPRLRKAASIALLLVAAFLVFGLHLRSMLTAWHDPESLTEYVSSPTPFWLVKLMDLGIIVPAAVLTGVALWRGSVWAVRITYLILTGYTCLGISVAAMAVVMLLQDDPDASLGLAAGFGSFALVFTLLTALLYRPMFLRPGPERA